jgi:N-acetylglutamate synthase-like GNAT family acetyltransferase
MDRHLEPPLLKTYQELSPEEQAVVQKEIVAITKLEPNLSKRTATEIFTDPKTTPFVILIENQLASFILHTTLSPTLVELHCLYTKPAFRGQKLSDLLIRHSMKDREKTYIAATFLDHIGHMLQGYGFQEIPLKKLSYPHLWSFVRPRLSIHRLREVLRHRQKSPLHLFIKKPCL